MGLEISSAIGQVSAQFTVIYAKELPPRSHCCHPVTEFGACYANGRVFVLWGTLGTLRELCVDDGSYECPRRHGGAPTLSIAGARFVLYPSSFAVTPPALRGGKTSGPLPARLLCTEHFFGYLDKHMVQTHPRPGSPPCPLSYAIRFKKAAKENTVKPCRQT